MKATILTLTYLVGFGELLLAIYFWVTNSRQEIRKVISLLALSTSIWVILSAYISYRETSILVVELLNVVLISGIFLVTSLLYFSVIYPYTFFTFDRLHKFLLYVPAIIFSIVILTTDTVVNNYLVDKYSVGEVVGGSVYPIYNIYLFILLLITLAILSFKIKRTHGFVKQNVKLILLSIVLSGLPAAIISLILPLFSPQLINPLLGNAITGIWLGITTYIVIKSS